MVKATDPGVPAGFRERAQAADRAAASASRWDLTGRGDDRAAFERRLLPPGAPRAAASLGNLAANPPFIHNPIVYNNTLSNLFAPGRHAWRTGPATVEALETTAHDAELGTTGRSVCAASSAGARRSTRPTPATTRYNMEMYYDLNGVPDGARFTDLIPANRDPTAPANATPTAAALPAEFLRPYRGYQNIRVRGNFGIGRLSGAPGPGEPPLHPRRAVRRRLHAAARARDRRRGSRQPVVHVQPPVRLLLLRAGPEQSPQPDRQLLLGSAGRGTPDRCGVLLDGWQVSGESDFVSRRLGQRLDHDDRQRSTSPAARRATAACLAGRSRSPRRASIWCGRTSSPIRWPAAAIR